MPKKIKCPFCGEEIEENTEKCPHCDEMFVKICPYCGEKIKIDAIKCKHCGEWLNNNESFDNDHSSVKKDILIVVCISIATIIISLLIGYLMIQFNPKYADIMTKYSEILDNSKNDKDVSEKNMTNIIKKSDYIGKWVEVYGGNAGYGNNIDIEDMGKFISVTDGGYYNEHSSRKSTYTCYYNDLTGYLICKEAKHVDTFSTCNGFSSGDNYDEYLKCEKETPELITKDTKTYSDKKERIISLKNWNNYYSATGELNFPNEDPYTKVDSEDGDNYYLIIND